jgi:nitrogen fixation protein FixH
MNWGYKIMLVYALFIAGIMVLVFKSSSQKEDLVTQNYYEQELVYQQKIDQSKRAAALSTGIKYELGKGSMGITFPAEMKGKELKVSVLLYCPSDAGKDQQKSFNTREGFISMPIPETASGMYELKIDWEADQATYYAEHKFFVQ